MLSKYSEKRFSTDDIYTVLGKAIEECFNNRERYIQLNGTGDEHKDVLHQFNAVIDALASLYDYFE